MVEEGGLVLFFACMCPCFPTPLTEEIVFIPLYGPTSFKKELVFLLKFYSIWVYNGNKNVYKNKFFKKKGKN